MSEGRAILQLARIVAPGIDPNVSIPGGPSREEGRAMCAQCSNEGNTQRLMPCSINRTNLRLAAN